MTSVRPTLSDDHGDRFPGAVRPHTGTPTPGAGERLVRMHSAYLTKVNSLVEAGRDDLVPELSETFTAESAGLRSPGRRGAGHAPGARRPARLRRLTRTSLQRFAR